MSSRVCLIIYDLPVYISSCLFSLMLSGLLVIPGVSCLWVLPCPVMSCLDVLLNIIIWVYILVCVFLFLPRVCTVTIIERCWWILMREDNRGWTYSQEKVLLCIMDSCFSWKQQVQMLQWWMYLLQKWNISLHKMLIDGLEFCGLLADYCDVLNSYLDSHSDGTHSLTAPIHCRGSIGEQVMHF